MSTELFSNLDARLRTLELLAGSSHTPPVEVTAADLKALKAELATLKAAITATAGDLVARTANPVTRTDLAAAKKQTIDTLVPVIGDAILDSQKKADRALKATLAEVHAEVQGAKNAASAQAQHSADFLRAAAAHFARG
jgi:hypothetical protein